MDTITKRAQAIFDTLHPECKYSFLVLNQNAKKRDELIFPTKGARQAFIKKVKRQHAAMKKTVDAARQQTAIIESRFSA